MSLLWKVCVGYEDDAKPVLVGLRGRRTPKGCRVERGQAGANFRVVFEHHELHDSKEDALAAWAAHCAEDVTNYREHLAAAIAMVSTEVQTEADP